MPPLNGYLGNYSHVGEGATVTYQCSNGYRPSVILTTVCTSSNLWIPAPEAHSCTLVIGNISSTVLISYVNLILCTKIAAAIIPYYKETS